MMAVLSGGVGRRIKRSLYANRYFLNWLLIGGWAANDERAFKILVNFIMDASE